MYGMAMRHRDRFLKGHGPYEYLLASVERPDVWIGVYWRDDGSRVWSEIVLIDHKDAERPVPFDHESRVEGYISLRAATHWFSEYCKRYGVTGHDVDAAIKHLRDSD